MKSKVLIASLFFPILVLGQLSKTYSIAYDYLITSDLVKSQLAKQTSGKSMRICKKKNSILYVCPTVKFINLTEYEKLIIDSCENLGLNRNELNDWRAYRNKYNFEAYNDPTISTLSKKRKVRYCFYSSFSKMNGRVLPVIVFNNEYRGEEDPCNLLTSIKFGEALTILLIFDKTLSKIKTALFARVALN